MNYIDDTIGKLTVL